MNFKWLLAPLSVQVFLTFFLLYLLGYLRVSSLKKGQVKIKDIALGQKAWPTEILKVDNCFHNQLETPLLFYVLIAMIGVTNSTDKTLVILAWVFVAFRLMHAGIEITSNYIINRFRCFIGATTTLLVMWVYFLYLVLA